MSAIRGYKLLNIIVKGDNVEFACLGGRLPIGVNKQVIVPHPDKHSMLDLAEYLSKSALGAVDVSAPVFHPAAV